LEIKNRATAAGVLQPNVMKEREKKMRKIREK
jgi:hypothetical protein